MNFFDLNKKSWQWILLLFLAFIWGSSFILMKKGLVVYNHTTVAALRISLAFLFLLPFAIYHLRFIKKDKWLYLIISGVLGNGIPAFLFTKAQTEVSSSLSGMLNSLTPIFALLLGILIFNLSPKKSQIIGVFIGLLGAIGLIISGDIDLNGGKPYYAFFIVAATICYAISLNVIKKYLKDVNSIGITAIAFLSIGPFSIIYLFTCTDFISITTIHPNALNAIISIIVLAVFGTAMAVLLFNLLIKKTSLLFTSSVTYLIPAFAILWGVADGETLNLLQILSLGIILTGIYFINKL